MCSVIPPDDAEAATKGEWTFIVHSRRKSYQLTTKTQADANRWINAIQDVIDSSPIIETPTEKLIDELKLVGPEEVAAIYAQHKVKRMALFGMSGSLPTFYRFSTVFTSLFAHRFFPCRMARQPPPPVVASTAPFRRRPRGFLPR